MKNKKKLTMALLIVSHVLYILITFPYILGFGMVAANELIAFWILAFPLVTLICMVWSWILFKRGKYKKANWINSIPFFWIVITFLLAEIFLTCRWVSC